MKFLSDVGAQVLVDEIMTRMNNLGNVLVEDLNSGFAPLNHVHGISDVTNLQVELNGKEATQTAASNAEAMSGTENAIRSWSPSRIKEAILALSPPSDLTVAIPAGTSGRLKTSSGTAGTVNELSSTVGSASQPVYINAGVPTAGNSIPSVSGLQSNIPASTNGYLATHSGTAGTFGTAVDPSTFLSKSGGTLTGALTLSGAPSSNLHAATKAYVDGITPTVADGSITNTKMANMAASTVKGRNTQSSGAPEDITMDELVNLINNATITAKTTPVDTDSIIITDSAASNVAKRVTFTTLKNIIGFKGVESTSVIDFNTLTEKGKIHTLLGQNKINAPGGLANNSFMLICIGYPDNSAGQVAFDLSSGGMYYRYTPTGNWSSNFLLSSSHNHSAANINTGTLAIARIPTGSNSTTVALGNHQHNGSDIHSIALGTSAVAGNSYNIAIGYNANAYDTGSQIGSNGHRGEPIAIGRNAFAGGTWGGNIAIGPNSRAGGYDAGIAIGSNVQANTEHAVTIGWNSTSSGSSILIGNGNNNAGSGSISIGGISNGIYSIAIGSSYSEGSRSTCLSAGGTANTAAADTNCIQLGSATGLSTIRARVSLTVSSDERDKTDIQPIENALDFINKVEIIRYVFNHRSSYQESITERYEEQTVINEETNEEEIITVPIPLTPEEEHINEMRSKYGIYDYDKEAHTQGTKKGSRTRVGVSAQQVISVLEETYGTDNYADIINDNLHDVTGVPEDIENQYTANYTAFIPFLIKSIQTLTARIKVLETELNINE